MKKFLQNLVLAALLAPLLQFPTAKALDQKMVCGFMNYQYASVEEKQAEDANKYAEFNDKIAVVTEERLGNADGVTSFNCFRQTECSGGDSGDTKSETPKNIRKCVTKFAETCNKSSDAQIKEAQKDATGKTKYTYCEPVRVYVTKAGTDLLYYYVGQIYRYVAGLGGLLAVLILIIAGVMRTTAGDNTNQITQANNLVTKSITGLVVLFLSAIILYTINPNFFII